ncbi:hypothetical protein G6O67_000663 [Ophiocordyceps sinensis]|nr:hypothetical protein G6O67_000663 [Ophiocordyceps sinensis]
MALLAWLRLRRRDPFDSLTLVDHLLSPLSLLVSLFYRVVLVLRGAPFHPPRDKPPVRVVCISDTHDHVVDVPPGDILIHAGDLTNDGSARAIQKQLDWLKSLPHQVKVVVAGNHDAFLDARTHSDAHAGPRQVLDFGGLLYLEGDLTVQEVKGRRLAIFGAPDIPECGPSSFAFQYTPAGQPWFSRVPPQTDILVTHGPPKHHLDLGNGCPHLLREVWRVRPRLHVFGHVHCAYGSEPVYFDHLQLAYERLLSRPSRGLVCDAMSSQTWLHVFRVLFHGVHSVLWKWFMGGPGSNHGGLMVNASQMYKNSGRVRDRAVVVDI